MTYQEAKDSVKAGKFIVIKGYTIDCDFGIAYSIGKPAYGVFRIDDYTFDGTDFKAVLHPMYGGFEKRAWYTSDITSFLMNDPNTQVFDTFEDADCFYYVLTHQNSESNSSWIKKFWSQIKLYWEICKNSKEV